MKRSYGAYRFAPHLVEMLREELAAAALLPLLVDLDTTDLMINENGAVYVEALGEPVRRLDGVTVDADALESILGTVASLHGEVITQESPILEAALPIGNARLQAVLPPLVAAPVVAIRKPPARTLSLDDLVAFGTLPRGLADELAAAVVTRRSVVVAGGVGSGKTTLLNALLAALLAAEPEERIVVLEEGARELHAEGANLIRLLTSDLAGVDMTRLLRTALRLNPDRILVGEVRGAEALDWLRASNTGHPGGLLTLHASGAAEAIDRLDALVQEAGIPSQLRRVAQALDLIVFLARTSTGRRVVEVLEVEGLDDAGRPSTRSLYAAPADGGPHPPRR